MFDGTLITFFAALFGIALGILVYLLFLVNTIAKKINEISNTRGLDHEQKKDLEANIKTQ